MYDYAAHHRRGLEWLLTHQSEEGPWMCPLPGGHRAPGVALTALAIAALAGPRTPPAHRPHRDRALGWLLDRQRADGGFGEGPDGQLFEPYATAFAVRALCATDRAAYRGQITRAVRFLERCQASSGPERGGIGVGMREIFPGDVIYTRTFSHPSTTAYVAEAIAESGVAPADDFWPAMATFFRGVHNQEAIARLDPPAFARLRAHGFRHRDDGGLFFLRFSGEPWDEETERAPAEPRDIISTGGTTLQGIIGYHAAGLGPASPELSAARGWLRRNYSLTEHVGYGAAVAVGQRGLTPGSPPDALVRPELTGMYQYLRFLARALSLDGANRFETADGARHDWTEEIAEALCARQRADGAWVNQNSRWLETEAPLSTAFALWTWSVVFEQLDARAARTRRAPAAQRRSDAMPSDAMPSEAMPSDAIAPTDEPPADESLQRWLASLLDRQGAVAGTVHAVDPSGQRLHLRAAVNIPPAVRALTRVIPRGKGMAGLALSRRAPVSTCNLADRDNPDVRPGARAVQAAAAVASPVFGADGRIRAVVGVAYARPRPIDEPLLDALRAAVSDLPPAEATGPRAQPPASPGDGAHSSERVHHGASSLASAPMGSTTCSPGRHAAAT